MDWKTFFLKFLRNIIISVVLCILVLGALGFALGGREGLVKMAYWGIALGLLGGFSWGLGMIFEAKFWGEEGNYKLFPEWSWFIKKSDDQDKKSDY